MTDPFEASAYPALNQWPLVLAGPILRRCEPTAITVWVALQRPAWVRLGVYEVADHPDITTWETVLAGKQHTWAVGQHLHLLAVTAYPVGEQGLACDRIYAYDLHFTEADTPPYPLRDALGPNTAPLSYFDHGLPTFALPPSERQHLKLVHGSCRKAHAPGKDALPLLDTLIAATASDAQERPHQLFLTGDQIYGDDLAQPLLAVASRLGKGLLGWAEHLPGHLTEADLQPGQRGEVATHEAGLTGGIGKSLDKVNNHLFTLGEYLAAYLLSFSPVCWPDQLPAEPRRQSKVIQQFMRPLGRVRRALANVPTYAIFDDHDVSDDWNLNQEWCLRVLGTPLGYRIVQNAMLAYALVQGWGNTPDQFTADHAGGKLLAAVQEWSAAQGQNSHAAFTLARCLGLPPQDLHTGKPKLDRDGQDWVLSRSPQALKWHYCVESPYHQVIVLDTRTQRGYPADESPLTPPRLLSLSALETQLAEPLQSHSADHLTLVVAPTNVFSLKVLDWIHRHSLRHRDVFAKDVGDAWNLPTDARSRLLTTLFHQRRQVVVLSGDIHFSFAVRLSFQSHHPWLYSGTLVQLTSSPIANEEPLTWLLHTRLKHWLLPERPRTWQGQILSAQFQDAARAEAEFKRMTHPDWRCHLTWVKRQPLQVVEHCQATWVQPDKPRWLAALKFWRGRWLQDGREVVGHNNLGVVQFVGNTVRQDSYWYAPWKAGEVVYSRFESDFQVPSPDDALEAEFSGETGIG